MVICICSFVKIWELGELYWETCERKLRECNQKLKLPRQVAVLEMLVSLDLSMGRWEEVFFQPEPLRSAPLQLDGLDRRAVREIYTEIECILHFAMGINFMALLVLMVTVKSRHRRLTPESSPFSAMTLKALLILCISKTCHQKCFCDI